MIRNMRLAIQRSHVHLWTGKQDEGLFYSSIPISPVPWNSTPFPNYKDMDATQLKQKKISTNHFKTVKGRELTFTQSLTKAATVRVGGAQGLQPDWHCLGPSSATCWNKQGRCQSNSRAQCPTTASFSPAGQLHNCHSVS